MGRQIGIGNNLGSTSCEPISLSPSSDLIFLGIPLCALNGPSAIGLPELCWHFLGSILLGVRYEQSEESDVTIDYALGWDQGSQTQFTCGPQEAKSG